LLFRTTKKTGDELSILGFGCMRLPQKAPGQSGIDERRATSQVRYAIDQGVNYVDTAFHYHRGNSETFLGLALKEGYREKVRLATKLPTYLVKTYDDMERFLGTQLDKLATDHIDYYLLHSLYRTNWETLRELGVLDFLEKAKKEGRILHTGFSFHGDIDTFKEIVDTYDWSMCQIQYNFLDEKNQAGTQGLEYAARKELGIVIMEPLRGGTLARKQPDEVLRIWNEADVKRSPAEWALRWVWNRPEVTVVLSGMNEEAHIEENLRIAGEALPYSLTEKELMLVKRVEAAYRGLTRAGCTGCRYCMPCPSGVDIPGCFEAYDILKVFNEVGHARWIYARNLSSLHTGPAYASLCKECGECLEKCPQHIPIPDLLKEVTTEFEDTKSAGTKMKTMFRTFKRLLAFQR